MARHHPQPRRQRLEQDGHHVGHQQDPDQRIAEPRPARQVRRPVPRVHVADTHQVGRPQERQELAQTPTPTLRRRHRHRAVHLVQRSPLRWHPSRRLSASTSDPTVLPHVLVPAHHLVAGYLARAIFPLVFRHRPTLQLIYRPSVFSKSRFRIMKNDFLDAQNRAGCNGGDGGNARDCGTCPMDTGHGRIRSVIAERENRGILDFRCPFRATAAYRS